MDDLNATFPSELNATLPSGPPVPAGGAPDELLAGRYRLGEVIGRGGSGEVFAADDLLVGDRVAVKFVPVLGRHAQRQLRRELSALLALRIPGVVRLRDEGTSNDRSFFVTERIDGVPFTDEAGSGWAAWRPRVLGLLDVLARVHLAGVVHRDLKPANVLVERGGRVVILDFGLAQGRLVERSTGGIVEGTPRYMAPEQRAAAPSTEQTDLYAAGGMILELVTGAPPTRPPTFDALRAAPVPEALIAVVERMLAEDPADRPESALDVLSALDADPRSDIGAGMPPGPWTEEQLRALFVDRKRSLLHLAEDAAKLLFAEAQGDERATRLVVERWIGAGLAAWSGDGRVVTNRSAIEQIAAGRPGSPQSELLAMLEAGADPQEVSDAARRIGRAMAETGHLERALAVLDAAELWARGTPSELGLLEDRVAWALGLETPQAAEQALYRVQRAEVDPEAKRPLAALLRGGRAAFGGDPERALAHLAHKPDGLPEALEILWQGARWKAVSQADLEAHERELMGIASWASATALRTSKWQGWLGYLRYKQQRYPEAADLLTQAAASRPVPRERALMLYMSAGAWLEAGRFEEARRATEEALPLFRDTREPLHEARVSCLARLIALRSGPEHQGPDLALVEAADDVPTMRSQVLLVEAAFAFHAGMTELCGSLAASARAGFPAEASDPVAFLADALRAATAPGSVDPVALVAALDRVTPQIAIQVLGLVALGSGASPGLRERAAALLPALAGRDRTRRFELVSIHEASTWLGIDDEGAPCPST